ncbi:hypothetical protein [Mycobacterium marseillense]|uniref:Uncharacterized protein n=2 Tax=Mycobacterium marseillense TaxID=701042 RepID=A0AAC9VVX3_9MYCO|nr:hypothetical protein [Mycobacterium marseillense]ASW91579.1 hypothetical protein CKJ54_18195 [Mycobacterium marseillense]MCA2263981.1 hypothetical protein [Mycobacterium marseillense]MCV7406068.1 hypothetical protein [Mycobacterium marseillense]MDM3974657.1 hypothetical protein [Mycobacterium marseillense]OBJ66961.1 hypothetical protein A5626_09355 [Mycobacterium marseillense]
MTQEFLSGVRSIVEPLLNELGFQQDGYDDVDESDPEARDGSRRGSVVFFRSDDCKIQVYESTRDGSINCMIAPLDAPNTFGPYDQSGNWQYLPRFAIRQGVPLDEIMKDNLAVDFPTTIQLLESVRSRIEKYYPVAHVGVLEMEGPDFWNRSQ